MFQRAVRTNSTVSRDRCCHDVLAAALSPFGKSKNKKQEIRMKNSLLVLLSAALLGIAAYSLTIHASDPQRTLAITMTNDPITNAIIVVDAATHQRLQTLSTNGKGGVADNAGGVEQYNGRLLAAVNNGSGTVAIFQRAGDHLVFEQLVVTTSAPVSVNFANGHMYVAGLTRVDSFVMNGNRVGYLDGTAALALAGGGLPDRGNTSQVAAADDHTLLVTLKTDPIPGTVDVITLTNGAIRGDANPVPAPAGTLAPFGFSVYPDGTAVITLAHSGHNGLFRDGAFKSLATSAGQAGNCWSTRVGKYVFVVNTGSRTITRVVGTGNNIFADNAVAATVPTGSPTDVDARGGYLAVIDHAGGTTATSHLTVFTYNVFGELSANGGAIDLGVPGANGMALMQPPPALAD
jgi:hypothetical protein